MAKFTLAISAPRGKQFDGFEGLVGNMVPAKNREGAEAMTKKGGAIYTIALNVTRIRKALEKFPELKKKDTRTGDDIIWLRGFEKKPAAF